MGRKSDDRHLALRLSRPELATVSNALKEALRSIDKVEFHARVGVTYGDAAALSSRLEDLLHGGAQHHKPGSRSYFDNLA